MYTHFIFTTIRREALILEVNRGPYEKYITGIVNNNACQLYAIYANPEHVHLLVLRAPTISEERLATIVADSSEKFINLNDLCKSRFQWRLSCSAFSVSKADIDCVCKYILKQPEHHKIKTFKEEYDAFIKLYQKTLKPK